MKPIVFGGEGFIGSHLVRALVEAGHSCSIVDRQAGSGLSPEVRAQTEAHYGDFTDRDFLRQALAGRDTIFHLISTTLPKSSNEQPIFDVSTNIAGSIAMFEEACQAGVRKVVFVSSGGTVYGVPRKLPIDETHATDPICSYGITKLAIEKYLHLFHVLHGLDYCVLRVSNPYGPGQRAGRGQGAIGTFIDRILNDQSIDIWGDGEVVRDYVHVADVAQAMVRAAIYTGEDRVFNIGSGQGHSLNAILSHLERISGHPLQVNRGPQRDFDVPVNVLAVDRARVQLGWTAETGLEEGLSGAYRQAVLDLGGR